MALKGWAELVHEGRLKELDQMDASMRKSQILKWIQEDGLDGIRARATWGRVLNEGDSFWDQIETVIADAVEEEKIAIEKERIEQERKHRYEYEVVKIERDLRSDVMVAQEASSVINSYAQEGWRLHTYSQVALSWGALSPLSSQQLTNVLHLVFERER